MQMMVMMPEWWKEEIFSARWHQNNFLRKLGWKGITRSDHFFKKLLLVKLFDADLWNGN